MKINTRNWCLYIKYIYFFQLYNIFKNEEFNRIGVNLRATKRRKTNGKKYENWALEGDPMRFQNFLIFVPPCRRAVTHGTPTFYVPHKATAQIQTNEPSGTWEHFNTRIDLRPPKIVVRLRGSVGPRERTFGHLGALMRPLF